MTARDFRFNAIALAVLALSACTASQLGQADKVAVQGQLYCAKAGALQPLTVALADASGVPVTVTNQSAAFVNAACAAWSAGAVPVEPPAVAVPTVAAPVAVAPAAG